MAETSRLELPAGAQTVFCEETVARIRELNERLIKSATAEGSRRLDAYEMALTSLLELTEKVGANQLEWLSALTQAHSEFIHDVTTAYTAAVRTLLG